MHNVLQMLVVVFIITLTGGLAPGPLLVATVNSSLKVYKALAFQETSLL
jgi:threonine/homoserine/homoserine lactone efflux protein